MLFCYINIRTWAVACGAGAFVFNHVLGCFAGPRRQHLRLNIAALRHSVNHTHLKPCRDRDEFITPLTQLDGVQIDACIDLFVGDLTPR